MPCSEGELCSHAAHSAILVSNGLCAWQGSCEMRLSSDGIAILVHGIYTVMELPDNAFPRPCPYHKSHMATYRHILQASVDMSLGDTTQTIHPLIIAEAFNFV